MLRFFLISLLVLLAACTRPQTTGFSTLDPEASVQSVFIATQRTPGQRGQIFGQARAQELNFARADISIPPDHELGRVERGSGIVDTSRHFAPVGLATMQSPAALSAAMKASRVDDAEPLMIFVHGYNNTLEDAVFRVAQIQEDFELSNPALLFSWPSAGDPLGYAYDRDSVLFARSDLSRLIGDLQDHGHDRILILAHSMGGYLVMEALRQLSLSGERHRVAGIEGLVLMSPDIDPDVFRRQAEEIGTLPRPFVIMTSQKDRVLNLSSLLVGRKERLGRIRSADELEGLDVTVLDFSLFEPGESFGHMIPVSSPEAIAFLRRLTRGLTVARGDFSRYVLLGEKQRSGLAVTN